MCLLSRTMSRFCLSLMLAPPWSLGSTTWPTAALASESFRMAGLISVVVEERRRRGREGPRGGRDDADDDDAAVAVAEPGAGVV